MLKSTLNILLIEDNPDAVELTLHAIKKNNIANPVEVLCDGQEALDYLFYKGKYSNSTHPLPGLILLDLKLPKVDGIEILRNIKTDRKLKLIPVIVLTSSKEDRDVIESYDLGVNSYIRKPVDFDQFVETVKHIQAEEALKKSEELYRTFINSTSDIVFVKDEQLRNIIVNKAFLESLGVEEEKVIGKTDFELLPESVAEGCRQTDLKALESGNVVISEEQAGEKALETRKFRINLGDNKFGIGGYIRNITKRKRAEEALLKAHGEMEIRVQERTAMLEESNRSLLSEITERKKAEEELKRSHKQLHDLSVHLQSIREEERGNIAREIHDELGQVLTALKMDVSWLEGKLSPDQTSLLEKTKSILKMIDATIQTVKKICTELRPAMLDHLGLTAAIEWQVKEFETRTGIKCTISLEPEEIILDRDLSTAVFRILQEMLTNVARHAKATKVDVSLEDRAGKVVLSVRDNGKGLTKEQIASSESFGLIGMKERAHHFRGEIKISSIRRKGTTITLSIPHQTVLRKQ
jgi:PAS domain S-box-containing protein